MTLYHYYGVYACSLPPYHRTDFKCTCGLMIAFWASVAKVYYTNPIIESIDYL